MKNTIENTTGRAAVAVSVENTSTDTNTISETGKCCLCGGQYIQYGTNPFPMNTNESARSCHGCDQTIVLRARGTPPATVKRIMRDAKRQGLTISEFLGNPLQTLENNVRSPQKVIQMTADNLVEMMKARGLTSLTVGSNFVKLLFMPGNKLSALGFAKK